MPSLLPTLFASLTEHAAQALQQDNKWLLIDPVYDQLDLLVAQPFDAVLDCILQLIETYPMLDYGGPGPFGSLIEAHPLAAYVPALVASLQRQPSTQVVGWLDRAAGAQALDLPCGPNPLRPADYVLVLEQVLAHPLASEACQDFTRMCLEDARQALAQ